jgi:ankyrin repeat protein
MLSRNEKDLLIVTSEKNRPCWASPIVEACYASPPGLGEFSCCALNHDFGNGTVQCDKFDIGNIMCDLLRKKIEFLFSNEEIMRARFFSCISHIWLRGLPEQFTLRSKANYDEDAVERLIRTLKWKRDEMLVGLDTGLTFAKWCVLQNNHEALCLHLKNDINIVTDPETRNNLLEAPTRVDLPYFGIPLRSTNLHVAMCLGGPECVRILLENGANPNALTVQGHADPLQAACVFSNTPNVEMWLRYFPQWNLNKDNNGLGSALCYALMFGTGDVLNVVKMLIRAGADVSYCNPQGFTPLIFSQMSKDSNPNVVGYLLKKICSQATKSRQDLKPEVIKQLVANEVNRKVHAKQMSYYLIFKACEFMYNMKIKRKGLVRSMALNLGSTALMWAARRGDAAMVRQLILAGADPMIKNEIGMSAIDFANLKGPFPAVSAVLDEYKDEGSMGLLDSRGETVRSVDL